MYKYDLHIHTSNVSRCAHTPAKELVRAYKALDFQGIVITDHFGDPSYLNGYGDIPWEDKVDIFLQGYKEAKEEGDKIGLDVFLGVELRLIPKIEFLIYGMDEDFLKKNEGLQNLTPKELYDLIRRNDLVMYQSHPYRKGVEQAPMEYMDGIEVINGGQPEDVNEKAYAVAKQHGLSMIAGSDNHRCGEDKCGIFTETTIKDSKDLVRVLKEGKYKMFCGLSYSEHSNLMSSHDILLTKRGYYKDLLKSN